MCVCLTYPINLGFEYFLTSQHHKVFRSYLVYCLLRSQNQNQNISLVPFIGGWDWKQTSVHDVCLRYWSIIFSGEPSSFKRKKMVKNKNIPAFEESTITHEHHQTVNTKIRLIIFFATKDEEALYSQHKQDQELTVAQIMNSLLPNSDSN